MESARGPYGGYRLGRGTRLPPVVFTEAEALGLVMTVLDGQPTAADAGWPGGWRSRLACATTGDVAYQAPCDVFIVQIIQAAAEEGSVPDHAGIVVRPDEPTGVRSCAGRLARGAPEEGSLQQGEACPPRWS